MIMRIGLYKAEESSIFRKEGGLHMKMRKTLVVAAVFTVLLGFLFMVPVHAQVTFKSWEGEWFQGKTKDKGVIVDGSGTFKAVDNLLCYATVYCWDGTDTFTSVLVQFDPDIGDDGAWIPIVYTAKLVEGTPLDYVVYSLIPPGAVPPGPPYPRVEALMVMLSIKGKEKDEALKSAKVTTVAASILLDLDGGTTYLALNESIKMKKVDETKVPDEVKAIVAGLPLPACP